MILLFFSGLNVILGQKTVLSGFVFDNSTGETLIGANLYDSISKIGTSTNNQGFFSLALNSGKSTIIVSYTGYQNKSYKLYLVHDTSLKLRLEPGLVLEEVQVKSVKSGTDFTKGRLTLQMKKLNDIPALGGESDLIKALTVLPGIAPANEGSSGMIVRGGGSDENLFILDGIQVYNTGHLFNFISVFNSEAIKKIDFYKGPFPSKYGGRLSSVTDITFRDGNKNSIKGNLDIGLINSKLTLDGPINSKTTFLFAARSTYFDIFTPFRRASIRNKQRFKSFGEIVNDEMILYTFADLNLKISHSINSNNLIAVNVYSGIDYYRIYNNEELLKEKTKYSLLNTVASVKTSHVISPRLFLSTVTGISSNLGYSKLQYTNFGKYSRIDPTSKERIETIAFASQENSEQKNYINDFSSSVDFTYFLNNSNTINFGISGIKHTYQPGKYRSELIDTIDNKTALIKNYSNKKYSSFETSTYIEDEINFNDRIHITSGLRVSLLNTYNKSFTYLEPRFSISANTHKAGSFILSYARMTQSSHALIRNDLLMYKTVWIPSTNECPPEKADLYSLGYIKNLGIPGYTLNIEAYYKALKSLIDYRINYLTQFSYLDWEESIIKGGIGKAYGIEVSFEKSLGNFTGNLNYTVSWNYRRFSELNNGNWFPYIFDRRHLINFSGAVKLNEVWKLSFLWTLSSGHRINFPVAYVNSSPYNFGYYIYEGLNSKTLPVYHRLDLGIEWNKKTKKDRPISFKLGIYNAYYRLNAYYLYVDHEYRYDDKGNLLSSNASVKKKVFLPIIPSINFSYKF